MRVRPLLLLTALAGVAATPAAAAQTPPERIAPGVTAGGVDVAGLTLLQATRKIKDEATPGLTAEPVTLSVGGRRWALTAAESKLEVHATKTARAAIKRTTPGEVPLVVQHSERAVDAFVARIARRFSIAPRNATLRITLRKMVVRRAKEGRRLDVARASSLVNAALANPAASRTLRKRLSTLRAPTNANDLRRQYGTVITVDKRNFKLRLFKQLKFSKSYGVATGMPAYPTPSGRFTIANKQVNPTWSVPNSPWAGELQGSTVAGGSAANPLKARWMGIANGIGIHGTGQEYSIGSRASHGCLRMRVASVIDLYRRVPVGTPILIA